MTLKQLLSTTKPVSAMWVKSRLLEYQKRMRDNPTECESELADILRMMGFESQVIVGGKRIVDFYHIEKRIVVELDGFQHYRKDGKTLKAGDRRRDAFLMKHGVRRVLHFSNERVRQEPLTVIDEIRRVCAHPQIILTTQWEPSAILVKRIRRQRNWPKRKFPRRVK